MPEPQIVYQEICRRCGEVFEKDEPEERRCLRILPVERLARGGECSVTAMEQMI
jgi:hypothetical protein